MQSPSGAGAGDQPAVRTLVAVRYTVLWRGRRPWNVGRERSFEEYRDAVFADDRMDLRAFLWQRIALRSLVEQRPALDPAVDRVAVFTSSELPPAHRAALDASVADLPWATIVPVDPDADALPVDAELRRFLGGGAGAAASGGGGAGGPGAGGPGAVRYLNVRLDDDDALARDHLARLRGHAATVAPGTVVSLSEGFLGRLDTRTRRFDRFVRRHLPRTSAGLALVGSFDAARDQFGPGASQVFFANHTKVHEQAPVVYDRGGPAFLKTIYPEQDTAAGRWRRLDILRRASRADVDAVVGLDRGI